MNFDARFVVVVLAAFATANAIAACVAAWQWRRSPAPAAPQDRASFLFQLRLLPVVASLLWASLATASFFFFESRRDDEEIGRTLLLLSTVGGALIVSALVRVGVTALRHHRMLVDWLKHATPTTLPGVRIPVSLVESDFPIVAVVGVFAPQLVIARSVIDACAPDELQAIIDHECGHIARHDNARRLLLLALPDPLGWLPVGKAIDRAWHDAAEEVADEAPGDDRGDQGRMALAAALIRVAKLAPAGQMAREMPASALYRGEPLEQRVRRLLDPIPPRPRAPRRYQWLVLALVIFTCVVLLNPIHELLEAAVTFLP